MRGAVIFGVTRFVLFEFAGFHVFLDGRFKQAGDVGFYQFNKAHGQGLGMFVQIAAFFHAYLNDIVKGSISQILGIHMTAEFFPVVLFDGFLNQLHGVGGGALVVQITANAAND